MLSKFKKRERQKLYKAQDKFFKKSKKAKAHAKILSDAQTFADVIQISKRSDFTLIVYDSRNPNSCDCPILGQAIDNKIFILNKIDLIPREVAIAWTKFFSQYGPTLSLSAINSVDVLAEFLSKKITSKSTIFITGPANLGKKTIIKGLNEHPALHDKINIVGPLDWPFLDPSPDFAAMGVFHPKSSDMTQYVLDFLFRVSVMSSCDVFSTTFGSEQTAILSKFCDDPISSSSEIINQLASAKIPYYAAPPCFSISDDYSWLSPPQKKALKCSCPYDAIEKSFLMLSQGTTPTIKPDIYICLSKMFPGVDDENNA